MPCLVDVGPEAHAHGCCDDGGGVVPQPPHYVFAVCGATHMINGKVCNINGTPNGCRLIFAHDGKHSCGAGHVY